MAFSKDIHILVVEDQRPMRKIFKNLLYQLGFCNISEALNGRHAMEILELHIEVRPVDLVIADWNMPDMSGIDLLYEVRCDPEFLDMPFLMVTAESNPRHVKEAVAAGVNEYLIKPFDAKKLEKKIHRIFAKLQSQQPERPLP